MTSSKKQLLSLSLLSMLVTAQVSAISMPALIPSKQTLKNYSSQAAYAILFAAALRFWSKEPNKTPYTLTLEKFIDELNSPLDTTYNMLTVVDEKIIGQQRKPGAPFANPDNGYKIEAGPGIPAKGLFGLIHSYWKPIAAAFGTVVATKIMLDIASKSDSLEDFVNKLMNFASGKLDLSNLLVNAKLKITDKKP